MKQPLSGQIALVTGASRGLGAATAVALAREGAHVVLIAKTVGGLEETDDRVRAVGGAATRMPLVQVAVNLTANQRLVATLDPMLRRAPAGRAVFVTDRTALAAKAYWSAYGATKAALEQMAEAWAIEAAIFPLRISVFDPGPMSTRLRAKAFPGEPADAQAAPELAAARLVESILA
jgi:NAD(P)-dependent dehydrogenase (short-subunit alcohol dehydrogenase family)